MEVPANLAAAKSVAIFSHCFAYSTIWNALSAALPAKTARKSSKESKVPYALQVGSVTHGRIVHHK